MSAKNFSILYSSSVSNSSNKSISKSKSKSKSKKKIKTLKSKSKSKSKTLKSKSKSKNNVLKPRRTLGELTNATQTYSRPIKTYSKYGKENRSWRKSKQQSVNIKTARDNITSLLTENNWVNKVNMSDIISIKYYPVEEMHIHLYEVDNGIGYHVKAKFPLNNWQLLLQYNVKTNDYDFVIKNNSNKVLMRENWRNKKNVIERLTSYKPISINSKDASQLLDNMLNITTIVEKVLKQNIIGGYKKNKTKKNKKRKNKKRTYKSKNKQ